MVKVIFLLATTWLICPIFSQPLYVADEMSTTDIIVFKTIDFLRTSYNYITKNLEKYKRPNAQIREHVCIWKICSKPLKHIIKA